MLVGALAGLLPGLFGFGGGWLLVPILVQCLGVPWSQASGLALCAILAGASSGTVERLTARAVAPRTLMPREGEAWVFVLLAAVLGSVLGKAWLRDWLAGWQWATLALDGVLAIALVGIAGLYLYDATRGEGRRGQVRPTGAMLACVGLATLLPGALSGLTGIGGGILYVPILLFGLRWQPDAARELSRVAVLASALIGAGLYGWSGGVDFETAAWMFVPAGLVGVVTSSIGFDKQKRRRTFALLASALASVALALTVVHAVRGASQAAPQGAGGLKAAVLAAAVPAVWGAACGLGRRFLAKPKP